MAFLYTFLCIDINECLNQDNIGSDPGNVCINTEGSYMFACRKPGYYYVSQVKNCIGKLRILHMLHHMAVLTLYIVSH